MADVVNKRVIELSPAAYAEILEKLVGAGYDWVAFPDYGFIHMDGFIVVRSGSADPHTPPSMADTG